MENRIIELIKEFCEMNELEFSTDYSGRYMYGETCVAISVSYTHLTLPTT